jgi:hypothetical protein
MATCDNFKRFLNGATSNQLSFFERGVAIVGSSLGQAAFDRVTGPISRIQVGNNVNSGVRALVDSVNSGTRSFLGSSVNDASNAVGTAAGLNFNLAPTDPTGVTIFNDAEFASRSIGNDLITGVIDEVNLGPNISRLSALAFIQQIEATTKPEDILDPECGISAYARDLIPYAPKHSFMFFVEFQFNPDYKDLGIIKHDNNSNEIKFHMLSKSFTRPPVNVEYEDVNMYNFHTKVAKRVSYEPFNIKLYDDIKNESMVFLEKYLKVRSPIARHSVSDAFYETSGVNYNINPGGNVVGVNGLQGSSASMGGLVNENTSILNHITVYHIFASGAKVNKYKFINPKIVQFDASDFDMESSQEPASIELQIAYDSMFVETDLEISLDELENKTKLGTRFLNKMKNK